LSSTRFEPLALTDDFRNCLALLEHTDDSYFITGKAGTGKSTLLQLFKDTTRKRVAIVAPTGIAALNVRGQTIHSFFGFPPYPLKKNQIHVVPNQKLYQKLEALVIDEISMVRADLLDQIDYFLRINRKIEEPFGGLQLICFGDLFQLPPVLSSASEKQVIQEIYETPYFFSSQALKRGLEIKMIELHHVYRQDEYHFIKLLDRVRTYHFDEDDLAELNARYQTTALPLKNGMITLATTNAIADKINAQNLGKIDQPVQIYHAEIEGEFQKNSYPTEEHLLLKQGAQVMFVRNDPNKEFVNGSIGYISHCNAESITVEIDSMASKRTVEVSPMEWHIIKYKLNAEKELEAEIIGRFRQYPLKLAWAITIHKSQGKTFDQIHIDLGYGAFEYGQTYVALSRCRTLQGIHLSKPLQAKDILVDPRIQAFYESKKKVPLREFRPWLQNGLELP
jgi:ATP-dependent DNA helicase PIF1